MFWLPGRLLAISLSLAILFWLPTANTAPAGAVTPCGTQATVSGRLNFASKVETDRVLICADWLRTTISIPRATASAKPKVVAPRAPKKPKTSKPSKPTQSDIRYSHSTSASPAAPRIRSSTLNPKVGQSVSFGTSTDSQSRFRYLLGIPAEVRFTPASYSWRLSDGAKGKSHRLAHTFQESGNKEVNLRVKFSIAFRFAGSKYWRKLSQPIWVAALPLTLKVGSSTSSRLKPRYVFYDCSQVADALGCHV
jgi:hypothetical protein